MFWTHTYAQNTDRTEAYHLWGGSCSGEKEKGLGKGELQRNSVVYGNIS